LDHSAATVFKQRDAALDELKSLKGSQETLLCVNRRLGTEISRLRSEVSELASVKSLLEEKSVECERLLVRIDELQSKLIRSSVSSRFQ
jgi:uncharacterized protein YigA (DUF484 family)